ncbi:VanZ family protein [Paenibacillus alkaliterrae]|uniref:VanZ family protein n=1 Tax=Paenibacillus alkaliterrae TaxID=320909 RepID=UPI001F237BA9|nr:VanZ family protein [Paenibacillus alkaliterrae]MCF2941936.1 VanZ family protein [Paenibacillus alkaliterrae]
MRLLLDVLLFVCPAMFVYLAVRLMLIRKIKFHFKREVLMVTFMVYIFALIFIVWIRGSRPAEDLMYNFIPFQTIWGYLQFELPFVAVQNIVGNIVITAPLGFYAVFNIRLFRGMSIAAYALFIPITIEFVQFLLFKLNIGMRSVDIDDVLLNSAGCLIGYYITRFFYNRYARPNGLIDSKRGI